MEGNKTNPPVKASFARRASHPHCNTAVGIAASSVAAVHRKIRSLRVQGNLKREDAEKTRKSPQAIQRRIGKGFDTVFESIFTL